MEEGGEEAGCGKPSPVSPSQTEDKPPVLVWVKAEPTLNGWEVGSGPWKGFSDACESSFGSKSETRDWSLPSKQDGIKDSTGYVSVKQEESNFGKGVVVMRGEDFIVEVDPDYESEDELDMESEVTEGSESGEMEVCADSSAAMAGTSSPTRQTGQSLCPASACLASSGGEAAADWRGRGGGNGVDVACQIDNMVSLIHSATDRLPQKTVHSLSLGNALHLGREGNLQSGGKQCEDSSTATEKSTVGACNKQIEPVHLVENRSRTESKCRSRRKISRRTAVKEKRLNVQSRDLRRDSWKKKASRAQNFIASGQGVPCHVCGKMFTLKGNMEKHVSTVHRGERPFKCFECGRAFSQKMSRQRHCATKHGGKGMLFCPECGRRFRGWARMNLHLETSQPGQSRFPCEICGKKFKWKCALNTHVCSGTVSTTELQVL